VGGACSPNGGKEKCVYIIGGKARGKKTTRWVDNIKTDLLEIGWGGVDWIGLAEDRDKWRALVNAIMNLRVPLHTWWPLE
jgi:hypothetical protein